MNPIVAVARRHVGRLLPPSFDGVSPGVDFICLCLGRPSRLKHCRTRCELFRALHSKMWFNRSTDSSWIPGVGDLVFCTANERMITAAGFVERIDLAAGVLWMIGADEEGRVDRRGYRLEDPQIVAFARP